MNKLDEKVRLKSLYNNVPDTIKEVKSKEYKEIKAMLTVIIISVSVILGLLINHIK